ncbi:hypothetical protein [Aquabacterium sp. A08]|uniref:hypothetical protein n=1 Tax=Aquabacterium sp. A08 TaxID=2718532 RepID=UPI00141E1D9A|nr:hypothetical protein [Aquabacterium sp. A08]NIC40898.1 hypothetical protein [Aquabacterium sp. A08]NIC43629.1 hypothetical protein [Aquabacterium sp. A08]
MSSFQHFLQSLQTGGQRHPSQLGLNGADGTGLEDLSDSVDLIGYLTALGYEVTSAPRREM